MKTAPTIDRFVFAGGCVLECEDWRGVEEDHDFKPAGLDLQRLKHLAQARAFLTPLCESPIEIALGAQLFRVLSAFPELYVATLCRYDEAPVRATDEVLIVPQFRYSRYRADLAVRFPWLPRRWVFIECDGKDFHSSARQVEHDRGRQQEMTDAGFRVFRFTGTEIWRGAEGCACEVADYGLLQRPREN